MRKVQIALILKGYDPGPADGTLSIKTRAALNDFQSDNKLAVTGTMSVETVRALGISLSTRTPSANTATSPLAPASPTLKPAGAPAIPWASQPTIAEVRRYIPDRAARLFVSGEAVISCKVSPKGVLESCVVVSEEPPEYDFGSAALRLAKLYQVDVASDLGERLVGTTIQVKIALPILMVS